MLTRKPVSTDDRLHDYATVQKEKSGVYNLKGEGIVNLTGNPHIQSLVTENGNKIKNKFDEGDEWKIDVPSIANPSETEVIKVSFYSELTKILGKPPEVLVICVGFLVVDPNVDSKVDFSSLFEEKVNSGDAMYELSGFAQNHHREHWTSVVRENGKWLHCNDSNILEVTSQHPDFLIPANYLVYKKIT